MENKQNVLFDGCYCVASELHYKELLKAGFTDKLNNWGYNTSYEYLELLGGRIIFVSSMNCDISPYIEDQDKEFKIEFDSRQEKWVSCFKSVTIKGLKEMMELNSPTFKNSLKTKTINELLDMNKDIVNEMNSREIDHGLPEQSNVMGDNINKVASMLNRNALGEHY